MKLSLRLEHALHPAVKKEKNEMRARATAAHAPFVRAGLELVLAGMIVALAGACSSAPAADSPTPAPTTSATSTAEADAGAGDGAAPDTPDPRLKGRPYAVHVPKSYDASKAAPLVLAFHGYGDGDNGALLEKYFRITPVSDANGFLYVTPEGTKDAGGEQFWNGTDACCDFFGTNPDDVGYIRALVADVAKHHKVDAKRVYAVGLSGGAFFVHRLACDAADVFAGIISVSGATYADDSKCKPTEGVAVLEIHGDHDANVKFTGGEILAKYPAATETVAHWAKHDDCSGALTPTGATLDLVTTLPGPETVVQHYAPCTKGAVELWTVTGGVHAPLFGPTFAPALWTFFAAHPKP